MTYPVSVCMIVRDEAEHIERCLLSVKPYVKEMIVVDTGSTDATREIAVRCGAIVHSFDWNGHFSDARNVSIEHATQPYVLILDADEQFDPEREQDLLAFCLRTDGVAGRVLLEDITDEHGACSTSEITRLFPNLPEFRYQGRIHEQLLYNGQTPETISTGVKIQHDGYLPEAIRKSNKLDRNLQLLLKALEDEPENAYLMYQIGRTYYVGKRYEEARTYFQAVIDLWGQGEETLPAYAPTLLVHFSYCLLNLRDYQALFQVVEIGTELYPDYTDLYFVYGVALVEMRDVRQLQEIRSTFEFCLSLGEPDSSLYQSVNGVGSYRSHYNLGVFYEVTGDRIEARRHYEAAANQGYALAAKRLQDLITTES